LQLLSPGQEVSVDPVYNDSVGVWVYLIAAAFQEITFYTESYLAFLYSVPQGWAPDNAIVLTPITTKPLVATASFAQKLVDRATNAIKNVDTATAQPTPTPTPAPGPPPRPTPQPTPQPAPPPTPQPAPQPPPAVTTIKLPSSAFSANANDAFATTFQNLAAGATATLPLFALSLDFSNNNVDLATDMQASGGTLVVVDADFVRVSVLTVTSNRLRNNSLVVPATIVSLVDAVTMSGNQVLNEAAYNAAPATRVGQGVPLSLLYFPINVNAPVIPCAFTGNLLFGASNLGLIRRNFAAPLDNWLFANAQL